MKKIVLMMMTLVLMSMLSGVNHINAAQGQLSIIKNRGQLLVGTSPDFAPREFYIINAKGEKEIVGSDIALAQAIADEIGVELKLITTDFNGVIANIQSGAVDMGISGFSYTEGRAAVMDFSIGYSQETGENGGYQGLLVTKDTAEKFKTLEELKVANLTIGAQGGSIQYEMAIKLTNPMNVKQYGTMDAEVLALNAGDIQAMVVATSSAEPLLASFDHLTILPRTNFDLDPENIYAQNVIGFPKSNDNKELLVLVNKVIEEAIENGDMAKWESEAKEQSVKAIDNE